MAKAKKLKSGSWRVQESAGKGADGKYRYISITRPTEKEANLAALLYETHHKDIKRNTANMTLDEAITAYINMRDGILSPSTILGYKRLQKNSLQDLINTRLNRLTQEDIQKQINKEAKKHAEKYVRNAHGLLSTVLKEYYPDFVLRTALPQKTKHVSNIPEFKDITHIVTAAHNTVMELPILLAVWMGMRMSEIRGLKWSDIKNGKIYIKNAIVDAEDGPALKSTKSYAGTRTLSMPAHIKQLIESTDHTGEYVVPLSGQAIYKRFVRLCKKHDIPHYRFHDLRHANASVMLLLHVPDKYAMERGGWATNSTLKAVYQHTITDERKAVEDRINAYFESTLSHELSHELLK